MKAFNQILVEQFFTRLQQNYEGYCEVSKVDATLKNFLLYLIDNDLINESDIRKYTIVNEFLEVHQREALKKTNIVKRLSQKFHISDRAIWSMLRKSDKKPNDAH